MSYDEVIIDDIKNDLDHLDVEVLRSIRELIGQSKRKTATATSPNAPSNRTSGREGGVAVTVQPLTFSGENLTLEEYGRLSLKERGLLQRRLKEKNHHWLQEKFSALNAASLVVVNGEIIASGKNLKDKPRQPQILEICKHTGKFPFVFTVDKLITIEENASAWHETRQIGDYYPTLAVTLRANSEVVNLVGDFDTGASHTFIDYDFLVRQNIIQPELVDYSKTHEHLNRTFEYVDKLMRIELTSSPDDTRTLETELCCVQDWNLSPFVAVNPNRTALIGRDILLELKPQVLLDFEKLQTEIMTAKRTEPARRKAAPKKNSAPPKRRRA